MELKDPSLHLKLQEMCDCYLDTSYEKELNQAARITAGEELEETATKYLSLAIMFGVTEKADSIKLKKKKGGTIKAGLKGDPDRSLPPPSEKLFDSIEEIIRSILHFEEGGGELPLSLGLRTGAVELKVKLKKKEEETSLKLKFPQW